MRAAAYARHFSLLVGALGLCPLASRAGGPEQDLYEEKAVTRCVERAVERAKWAGKTDRALWMKELESAFPGKVGNPAKDEEYAAWFKLVAGEAEEWRRDGSTNKVLTELFDRTLQRLELGPVPSIKKDEFMKYARHVLAQGNPKNGIDTKEEADKLFRVLDRDGDGVLTADEWTTKLKEDRVKADADGNGKIDKTEYRESFNRRVMAAADIIVKADPKAAGKGNVPGWFADLDTDKDGQVALHEWRRAGKPIELFMKMDLDGDGLLTPEEYARYIKMNEAAPPPKSDAKPDPKPTKKP